MEWHTKLSIISKRHYRPEFTIKFSRLILFMQSSEKCKYRSKILYIGIAFLFLLA